MPQTTNIFGIAEPEKYVCFVTSYIPSHSQLEIGIKLPETPEFVYYLGFQAVEYFEGPLSWEGADFSRGDPNECVRLLRLSYRHKKLADSHLMERFHLFYVPLSPVHPQSAWVKIIAATGDIFDYDFLT
jgi:hypothetical protein